MPLLAALDECLCALTAISTCAKLGLENPALQPQALQLIQQSCDELGETLEGIFAGEEMGIPDGERCRSFSHQ